MPLSKNICKGALTNNESKKLSGYVVIHFFFNKSAIVNGIDRQLHRDCISFQDITFFQKFNRSSTNLLIAVFILHHRIHCVY